MAPLILVVLSRDYIRGHCNPYSFSVRGEHPKVWPRESEGRTCQSPVAELLVSAGVYTEPGMRQ